MPSDLTATTRGHAAEMRLPVRRPGARQVWTRVGERLHEPLAGVLTLYLGFRSGGYFPNSTGYAVVAVALCLVLRLAVTPRALDGWSRRSAVTAAAGTGLACWILLSALWSNAPERALLEFDRAMLYLLVFAFYTSVPWRPASLAAALRWVLLAFTAIAIAGLAARLIPDLADIREVVVPGRLSYPVSYWNGLGVACAIGFILALHAASALDEPAYIRVLATAALPITAVAIYFTFSRGGAATLIVGTMVYVGIARPRRLPATLLVGGLTTWVALRVAYAPEILATPRYASPRGLDQGHELARQLAVLVLVALLGRLLLVPVERWIDAWADWLPPVPRRIRLIAVTLVGIVAVGIFAAVDLPSRIGAEIDAFEHGNTLPRATSYRGRFRSAGNNGRLAIWRVAIHVYHDAPLHGTGAGTFRLDWFQRRTDGTYLVNDVHSLYLEALAELGWPGLLLVLATLGSLLVAALRRATGRQRHAAAAVVAAGGALALHAALDWDWELPVLFVWLFAAGGMVCAAERGTIRPLTRSQRICGGLILLFLAIVPLQAARSQDDLVRSTRAFAAEDCATAVDAALDSIDALSIRAQPFETLAWCDLRGGSQVLAESAMRAAQARDPRNWQYAYGLAVVRAARGLDPHAAVRRAQRLNPRYGQVRWLAHAMRGNDPERWRREALKAPLTVDR